MVVFIIYNYIKSNNPHHAIIKHCTECPMCWWDSKASTVTSYTRGFSMGVISLCWLCYPVGMFGTWRNVQLSHGAEGKSNTGCLKKPNPQSALFFYKLATSYQSKCHIFEKYTLLAIQCQKILSNTMLTCGVLTKMAFQQVFHFGHRSPFINKLLPMVDWCFHFSWFIE